MFKIIEGGHTVVSFTGGSTGTGVQQCRRHLEFSLYNCRIIFAITTVSGYIREKSIRQNIYVNIGIIKFTR